MGPARCPQCLSLCCAPIHGGDPTAESPSHAQTQTQTPKPPQVQAQAPPSFLSPSPGEEALEKALSLSNLLLMIFVPLLALLVLAALTALFLWKLAQHRRERLLFKHSDLGDTDLMLKASLVGDSTLEVGGHQGGRPPAVPKRGGRAVRGGHRAHRLPWFLRTC